MYGDNNILMVTAKEHEAVHVEMEKREKALRRLSHYDIYCVGLPAKTADALHDAGISRLSDLAFTKKDTLPKSAGRYLRRLERQYSFSVGSEADRTSRLLIQPDEKDLIRRLGQLAYKESFRRTLLARMKSDCLYYLGLGLRNRNILWGQSPVQQIRMMKTLYESFPASEKPDWISAEDIRGFERRMVLGA